MGDFSFKLDVIACITGEIALILKHWYDTRLSFYRFSSKIKL